MTRFLTVASLACAAALATGCGGGDDAAGESGGPAGAATSSSPAGTAPAAIPGAGGSSGEAGIGASEARSSGVFSADFDAALRGPDHATAGSATLRLVNVGRKTDSYRLAVLPAGAGTVTPATARLEPGAVAALTLDLTADASVHVVSDGRGTEVADLPVKLR